MEKTEKMKWERQHHVKKSGGQNSLGTPLDLHQLLCFRSKNINKRGKIQHLTKGSDLFGQVCPYIKLYHME